MGAHQNSLRSEINSIPSNTVNEVNEVYNNVVDINTAKEDMKSLTKSIIDLVLHNKRFDPKEVKKWGDDLTYGLRTLLKRRYPQYAYCICVYISDRTGYVSNDRIVYYKESDIQYIIINDTDTLYAHVRVNAYKKRPPKNNFENNMCDSGLFSNINNLLNRNLDGKKFEFKSFQPLINNICGEINELLLARIDKPCSYHVGYINKLPMKGVYFDYKIFDAEYYPIFFNYSNNSFICRVCLFLINI